MVADFPDEDPGRKQFNGKELEAMEFTCERAVSASHLDFVLVMLRRLPSVEVLLGMDDHQFHLHLNGSTDHDDDVRRWDREPNSIGTAASLVCRPSCSCTSRLDHQLE